MKYLVLLYPITPYIEAMLGKNLMTEEEMAQIGERYQQILEARYPGHQRVCVFFSRKDDPTEPDLTLRWRHFSLTEGDVIGTCGVPFTRHCSEREYPQEEDILALCNHPIEDLVIVGFHLWDCVDRLAEYAWSQKLPARVDEDLTELFFIGFSGLHVPFSLEESTLRTRRALRGSALWNYAKRVRRNKPWLMRL